MPRKKLVRITNQSFHDAGGLEVFPKLEMIGLISAGASITGVREPVSESANEELMEKARENGMTHVFRVEYDWGRDNSRHSSYGVYHTCFATGTGYKPKDKSKK